MGDGSKADAYMERVYCGRELRIEQDPITYRVVCPLHGPIGERLTYREASAHTRCIEKRVGS